MGSPNLGLFNVPTISDFQREEEDFLMRKQQGALQNKLMQKQLQQAQEVDIKALSDRALFDFYQGKPLDDQGRAAIQARAVMEGQKTQYTQDPLTGQLIPTTSDNAYSSFLSGLDGGQFKPAQTPRSAMPPQVFGNMLGEPALEDANIPPVAQDTFSFDGYGGMDPMQASQNAIAQRKQYLANGNPYDTGSALPVAPQLDDTALEMAAAEEAARQTVPYKKQFGEELAKTDVLPKNEATKAAIGVMAKGDEVTAIKQAEYSSAKPKKLDAIGRIKSNMLEASKSLEDLPRGKIQQAGKYAASDIAGFPTKMATASAKINTLLPAIVQDIKQLVREPGEGTFTDADQALVAQMAFDPNAPLEAKLASYEALMGVMERYEQSLGKSNVQPIKVEDLIRKYSQ